jgi:hypothetical protein
MGRNDAAAEGSLRKLVLTGHPDLVFGEVVWYPYQRQTGAMWLVDIFISYARSQRALAEPIKERLEALGYDVFFDIEGIDGGADFPEVIDRALRKSKVVLACWSPTYFTRKWCLIEARIGVERNIIVPIAVESFAKDAPPADLRFINYFDVTGRDPEAWALTLRTIQRKLAQPESSSAHEPLPPQAGTPQTNASALLSDMRATWAAFPDRESIAAVSRFAERVRQSAPGSGLEFEVEHHLKTLHAKQKSELAKERADQLRREKLRETLPPMPNDMVLAQIALVFGVGLYVAAWLLTDIRNDPRGHFFFTPLFCVPLIAYWINRKRMRWWGALLFVILVTGANFLATMAADAIFIERASECARCSGLFCSACDEWKSAQEITADRNLAEASARTAGAVAGAIGAGLSFLFVALALPSVRNPSNIAWLTAATAVMIAIGGFGLASHLPNEEPYMEYAVLLFAPWQLVFGWTLLHVTRAHAAERRLMFWAKPVRLRHL